MVQKGVGLVESVFFGLVWSAATPSLHTSIPLSRISFSHSLFLSLSLVLPPFDSLYSVA